MERPHVNPILTELWFFVLREKEGGKGGTLEAT
jgi:hypothetical protein